MTSVCALVSSELLTMRGPSKNCLAWCCECNSTKCITIIYY
jgi:hypothetical protein